MTGDSAFEAFYQAQYDDLLRYALRRVDQPADAADIVAETWVVAWRRRHDLPPVAEQRLWLFGTARRVLANHRRGRVRASRLSDKLAQDLQATARHVTEPDEPVRRALSQLSERDREVLFLSAWEDLPPGDIATVLGCSAATARVRLHRARARFRDALSDPPAPAARTCLQPLLSVEGSR